MNKSEIFRMAVVGVLLVTLVFTPCVSALDYGYSEIVDYEPDESIMLKLVIQNPLSKDINLTYLGIHVPWGTDFSYSNTPLRLADFFPSAADAVSAYGSTDGTKSVRFRINNRTILPHSSMEILLKLKINDWEGYSPNGETQWADPFNYYAKDRFTFKDIFIEGGYGNTEGDVFSLCPRVGTFADYGEYLGTSLCLFDITPDIVGNEYGISTSVSHLEPGKPENVTVTVWNGNGTEVKNATVNLTGCGVSVSNSTYPYEFERINATSIGKISVTACWVENNITLNAVDFIPVSPSPNHNATFDIYKVTPVAERPINISATVTDAEGIDMVLVKYWKDRPWRMYVSMEEGDNNIYSTNIGPFWSGDVVNYQLVCIDKTGNMTESEINQFTVTPYGVSLAVNTTQKSTMPNVNATYIVTLENIGTETDSFNLFITNPDNASIANLSKRSVCLAAGANETILLNVTDEMPGTYRINVTAISINDPNKIACINTTTVVMPAIEVQVWAEPTEITPGNISIIFARVTENKTPVSNVNVTFTTDFGMFTENGSDTYINTTNESGIAVAHFTASESGTANITATTEPTGVSNSTTIRVFIPTFEFDTRGGDYPSIPGTYNGTITPSHKIIANKLYTYPCAGTGGHSEYMWIGNLSWSISSETWEGYTGDWHNLTFNESFVLEAGETYNYTIRTGSYPQIIHRHNLTTADGVITCTEFRDVNGVVHYDWIPAIRLFAS